VTLIANYIPLEGPAGGPNFYEFGDDVLYAIHIDNDGDSLSEIAYEFRFETKLFVGNTFLYNTGTITSLDDPHWNKRQFYTVSKVDQAGNRVVLASGLKCPPCNIGPFSTPNYAALAQAAVTTLPNGEGTVFAGQRAEGFYVDLGSVFDELDLRAFQSLHVNPLPPAPPGVNGTNRLNVHTIAIQVPMTKLTRDGKPPAAGNSIIGVYASASRQKASILDGAGDAIEGGPFVQVSRLANPLVNEAMIPIEKKDFWNSQDPKDDEQFIQFVKHQEVPKRLVEFYQPAVFPNLAAFNASGKERDDMVAIFLTGIPGLNQNGGPHADLLRLNMAIPPATDPKLLGVLAGDFAGFPNGRRVFDDVFTIELRAIAGLTIPLVDSHFTPDGAASKVSDNLTPAANRYISTFPYLGVPLDGYSTPGA
jgi:hypothetical protein